MIYLILGGVSAFFGLLSGVGATTLLRPLLDAVSPLAPASVAALCTMATLCAALVAAFFALNHALPLHPDELLLLAVGAALGGVLGDLASARFFAMMTRESAMLLQNALLFTLIALPSLYFGPLSRTVAPMRLSRLLSFAVALLVGLLGSFLAFGAEPLTLTLYFLLFGADGDEGAFAALTVSLFAMVGKLLVLLIRQRLVLPDADVMLWLLPGAVIGALLALWPAVRRGRSSLSTLLLRLSLFTSLLNIAAAALHYKARALTAPAPVPAPPAPRGSSRSSPSGSSPAARASACSSSCRARRACAWRPSAPTCRFPPAPPCAPACP